MHIWRDLQSRWSFYTHWSPHIYTVIIIILLPIIFSAIPFHYTDSDGEGWTVLLDKADQRESLPDGFSWSLLLSFTGNKRSLFSARECWGLVSFLMSELIFWAKLFVGSHCVFAIDERREMTFRASKLYRELTTFIKLVSEDCWSSLEFLRTENEDVFTWFELKFDYNNTIYDLYVAPFLIISILY